MEESYNLRNPAVKRLMREAHELREATEQFSAHPLEDNLFEWHFTIRGPDDTDFAGGFYHGRILLPPEYPMKPPSIILLTPSGRFETNKKICLSISGYHPETWLPSWSLRTALLGIIGFMPSHGGGAIGSLEYTSEERRNLARKSQGWKCPHCGLVKDLVLPITKLSQELKKEAQEIGQQIKLTGEKKANQQNDSPDSKEKENSDATTEATASSNPTENTKTSENNNTPTSVSLNNQNVFNYQFPPFNVSQQFPIAFPQYPLPNADQSQSPQPYNPNVIPPQFMWQLPQNYFPFGIHQSMPSHLPTFPTVSSVTPTTVTPHSVGTTFTTSVTSCTTISSAQVSTNNTTDNIKATSTSPSNEVVVSSAIKTSSAPTISTDIQLPLNSHASPSSTQNSTPTTTELRQRLKSSVNTTESANVSSSQATLKTTVTSSTDRLTTSSSTPRVIQTNSNAEIRRNFRGSSGFFDISLDLLIIVIFFLIFTLIVKRLVSFFFN